MYNFFEELKSAYESMSTPLAFYQFENDQLVPLLVSDGFCEMMGLNHEQLIDHLFHSTFEKIHPDDTGKITAAVSAFIRKEGPYDLIYRSHYGISDDYHYVHSYGTWQTMPDGTELMCVLYLDLEHCIDETQKLTADYKLFQEDHFYTDRVTGLPNLNYMNQFADERVNTLRIHSKTPVLIYADVISMQYYNNQYGFSKGNELLKLIAETLHEIFPDALVMKGSDDHFILIDAFESEKQTEEKIVTADNIIQKNAEGNTTGIKAGACVYQADMTSIEAMDNARDAIKWLGNDLNRVCHFYTHVAEDHY